MERDRGLSRVWPALLVAPLLALASIGFGYALVPSACAKDGWLLHGFIFVCLLVSVATTGLAYADRPRHKEPFLPLIATWSGAFFSLVIAAQWATTLFISPCTP